MKKMYLFAAVLMMAALSCESRHNKTAGDEINDAVQAVSNTDTENSGYYGVYKGTLPCADCGGIKTELQVLSDGTYKLRSEYLGKKDAVFEESGVYNIINGNVIELVTPSSGDKTYYKILEGAVAMSDSAGNTADGVLAKNYILKKQ